MSADELERADTEFVRQACATVSDLVLAHAELARQLVEAQNCLGKDQRYVVECNARAEAAERQLAEALKARNAHCQKWLDAEHRITSFSRRAETAERQLAEARKALEWYARCDIAAKAVCEGTFCRMEHDDGERARVALRAGVTIPLAGSSAQHI